ncbi:CbtA family protein [Mycobacterium sp. CVI_P3]|uniref:CbtA family protein n=1 Tax=Mycobacterium pinniadriaticum TaxID=2994102 RepID=A0ABT3SI63_9MYCO|nr:CbtA family protein [Mycobacterium pinniadriaticum]MCX2932797.1 CbtA family protein [Mycobacterium pinniadriaticum]MCX2939143.1 CbtA family protein [Mycobacterium pinniadriaticum]
MNNRIIALGLVAGLVSGLVSFAYVRLRVSPLVDLAIGQEEGGAHPHAPAAEHELFSRAVQENVGAGVGTVMFAIVLGALLSVAVSALLIYLNRRGIVVDPRWPAGGLAAVGFLAVNLVPFLAFPANPPGVGAAETISPRTSAYLVILVVSVALAIGATILAVRLSPRVGGWTAIGLAFGCYLPAVTVVALTLPRFDEMPAHFPAGLLADFRLNSILTQAIMWLTLGVVFAAWLPRALTTRTVDAHS